MRSVRLLLPALCALFMSCTEYSNVLKTGDYEYKYEAAKALYADGHYRQAAELFSLLLAPLKGTSYGEESLFMLGESNLKAKDYESAVMFLKKYYQTYSKGQYTELARYGTGYALYKQTPDVRLDQSSTMQAIKEFQDFLDHCPETTLKEQVHEIIFALQDKLVEKEYLSAKFYYDLGTYTLNSVYGGNNYEACVVTAQNALKDYPYASQGLREELSILTLRAKYTLARQSVDEKRVERYRDAIDEFYAFENDFPESRYMKEAKDIFASSERIVQRKGSQLIDEETAKRQPEKMKKEMDVEGKEKVKKTNEKSILGGILQNILNRR